MQYKKLKAETADFISGKKSKLKISAQDTLYEISLDDLSIALLGEQIAAHTADIIRKKRKRA